MWRLEANDPAKAVITVCPWACLTAPLQASVSPAIKWRYHHLKGKLVRVKQSNLIPGFGRSPGVGNGNPCQYSCLEKPTDRGAQQIFPTQGSNPHLLGLLHCRWVLYLWAAGEACEGLATYQIIQCPVPGGCEHNCYMPSPVGTSGILMVKNKNEKPHIIRVIHHILLGIHVWPLF